MHQGNPNSTTRFQAKHWRPIPLGQMLCISLLTLIVGLAMQTNFAAAAGNASYTVIKDSKSQTTIFVTGAGSTVTLAEIASGLGVANTGYLTDLGNGLWRLNANLWIDQGVTLTLSPATGVHELQLRSDSNGGVTSSAADEIDSIAAINYKTFVYLKTENGIINIDGAKIYSWDAAANAVDTNYSNGRAYILAKLAATLTVRNADIGYLGSADGESYGLAWRDVNATTTPDVLRTRVTGEVIDSKIHHNYYGIYTYQAQNMTFRGNEFYSNVRYGFDPHDYSHHVLVENNVAYNNGAHGFIISRGCNNFIFRNNKSYNNFDPGSNLAHGFMLDPGGADIDKPQVSSANNLLENNEAYNNEGYGLRMLGSGNNTIRNNYFHHNDTGMTLDGMAVDSITENNVISGNRFEANTKTGIVIREAYQNQILGNNLQGNLGSGLDIRKAAGNHVEANTITASGAHGVILSDSAKQNFFLRNTIQNNKSYGIGVSGATPTGNRWSQNLIFGNGLGGIQSGTQLLAAPVLQTVTGNNVTGQAKAGVTIEIFADSGAQGQFFVGQTTAGGDGQFTFTSNTGWNATNITAIAVDGTTNASPFSAALPAGTVVTPTPSTTPTPTVPATMTATATATSTATSSATPTPTGTQTVIPVTATATATMTPTVTPIASGTVTPTSAPTQIATPTPTVEGTPIGSGDPYHIFLPNVSR